MQSNAEQWKRRKLNNDDGDDERMYISHDFFSSFIIKLQTSTQMIEMYEMIHTKKKKNCTICKHYEFAMFQFVDNSFSWFGMVGTHFSVNIIDMKITLFIRCLLPPFILNLELYSQWW